LRSRHRDPPSEGAAPSLHPRAPSPCPRHSNQPWLVAPMPLGATVRPSSMAEVVTGGGGAPDSSTVVAMASHSSTCTGSGSAHGSWGRGSEGTTRTLWAKRFRGARLSTPVSSYLREDRIEVSEQNKLKNPRWRLRGREITFWSAPGTSSLGGPTSPARGLQAWSPPTRVLLRFDLLPQRWQYAPPTARGLILRPLRRPGLVPGPRRRRGKCKRPGPHRPG
jgi:hypothetical protein